MLTLNDGRSELWQWDTGRTLAVDADCSQVHFSNKVFGRSIDVDVVDGAAVIPDVLLQTDKDLNVWAFVGTAENGYTKISKTFKINRRNKPSDYVFTQTDQMTLQTIQRQIGDLADLTTEAKDTLVAAINEAAKTGSGEGGTSDHSKLTNRNAENQHPMSAITGLVGALNGKVSVADIIDNLTTNVTNKPLSAAQGVALKALIDAIRIPEKLPNPNALTFTGAVTGSYDGSAPVSVEIPSGGGSSGGSTAEWQLLGTYAMLVSDRVLTIDLSQFNGITHFRIIGNFPKCSNDCGDTCIYLGTNFNHTQQTLNAQNVYAFNLLAECELVDGQLYGLIGTIDGWNRRPVASVAMNSPRDSGKNTNFKIYYTKLVEDSTENTIQIWGY